MSANALSLVGIPSCRCYACGAVFYSDVLNLRQRDGDYFYCPNGHRQVFIGESTERRAERLERELANMKTRAQSAESRATVAEENVKRLRKGKCPCCKQEFRNVYDHMRRNHPNFK